MVSVRIYDQLVFECFGAQLSVAGSPPTSQRIPTLDMIVTSVRNRICQLLIEIGALWISLVFLLSPAIADDSEQAKLIVEQKELLEQHNVATDTPGLVAYLRSLSPDEKLEGEIAALLAELGDRRFKVREAADTRLRIIGDATRQSLVAARDSNDPELAWRANTILQKLNSTPQGQLSQALMNAVFVVLEDRQSPTAAATILETLPRCDEPYLTEAACEALWASVDQSHVDSLDRALEHPRPVVVAAAIVAYELAFGNQSTDSIERFLDADQPLLQLAAARALVDRQSQRTADVLVELSNSSDERIATQAEGLLAALSGKMFGQTDWSTWRDSELATANLAKLGAARLDSRLGCRRLYETFDIGIGRLEYETGIGPALLVENGVAAIGGRDQPEGDQRLFLTAKRFNGCTEFPDKFVVETRLGVENYNNSTWHLGVSIGQAKFLFHPGFQGGAFRAETVDDHQYLSDSQDMGFTPQPDVTHQMTIVVSRDAEVTTFDVSIVDGQDAARRFTQSIKIRNDQVGKLDRIGLERSGRLGGEARFDEVRLELQ